MNYTMKTTRRKYASFIVAALFSLSPVTHAGETLVVGDDFQSGKTQWDWHGDIADGKLVLTSLNDSQYGGSQILLKPEVQIGDSDKDALHIHLVIDGITSDNDGTAEARIFLVPAPLDNPTFADPSSTSSALTLLIGSNATKGTISIALFNRTNSTEPGYGMKLYSATLPVESYPLTVDWYLSRKAYKLNLGKPAQTIDGSRQESWELSAPWNGSLRFVMRIVNITAGAKSALRVSDFSISTGAIPE
jgi:hypothetical protein